MEILNKAAESWTQTLLSTKCATLGKLGFPGGADGKELLAMQVTQVRSLGQENPLEKGMATHSIILAWRIPWMEEPGRLQSVGSQRVK